MVVGSNLVVVHSGFAIMVVVEGVATDVVNFFSFFFEKRNCKSYFSILECQSSIFFFFLANQILTF